MSEGRQTLSIAYFHTQGETTMIQENLFDKWKDYCHSPDATPIEYALTQNELSLSDINVSFPRM
jgi:hypothetical protein